MLRRRLCKVSSFLLACLCLSCGSGKGSSPTAPTGPGPIIAPALSGPSGMLVGAGDIGFCGTPGAEATARLLDRLPGTVFTAGDNAYDAGTRAQFQECYGPTWGRHLGRTRPVAGNHEYTASGAAPYFEYFGGNAGPGGAGYYSYTVGPWVVI